MKSQIVLIALAFAFTLFGVITFGATANAQEEPAPEYFNQPGLDVLVFSNWYDGLFSDAKISGVELIQHGVRVATNGDVRLDPTPGQWEAIGSFKSRETNVENGVIEAQLKYPDYEFDYSIRVEKDGDGYLIKVSSEQPLPKALAGRAGFNLEFVPSVYGGKAYTADGAPGVMPVYPAGDMILRKNGPRPDGAAAEPLPFAKGRDIVLAAGDVAHRVRLTAANRGEIAVYDGRNQAQNGWFVARGMLPSGRKGVLLEWRLEAAADPQWVREPVISHNQLGYHPARSKVAMIEFDKRDPGRGEMTLLRFDGDGAAEVVLTAQPESAGEYLRYNYATFDFSSVRQPGVYALEYDGQRTAQFIIAADVYDNAWRPTLDVFFPAQMDHMFVNEAYRVWHGRSHMDDALQAPVDHEHHDLYRQGPTTDTAFAPLEHIPGLNVGGWYDAGDFDIRTQSQYATVRTLVMAWDDFRPASDQTKVDWARGRVDMHTPDGDPDILQQIKHGALQLIAQYDAVGHAIHGIVEPDLDQYTHLGDGVTKTDNLIFDASLGPDEISDNRSGKRDDRWAFTSKSSALQYGSAAGMAAAARALKDYDRAFSDRLLAKASEVFDHEEDNEPATFRHGNTTGGPLPLERMRAAIELLLTTKDKRYATVIDEAWADNERFFGAIAPQAFAIRRYMPKSFETKLRAAAEAFVANEAGQRSDNPFGVIITRGGWAGSGAVKNNAISLYAIHRAYPDLVGKDQVYDGFDFLLGRHPGHNLSLVSGVGAQSKKVAYGTNRADFSYIAGGVVPGVLIIKPDYPENREDWPFMWGQNEYVIPNGAQFIYLANAVAALD